MSTRHADRELSVYPIIGIGFATLAFRADVFYTHKAQPRNDLKRPMLALTPRHWCVHWSLAAGSWQTGGNLCEPIERIWNWALDIKDQLREVTEIAKSYFKD